MRKLVANMAEGVSKGFTRVLEINGVGYRAEVRGSNINLTLGYSHPIVYQLPPGVTAKVDRQVVITLESADRQLLGSVAAEVRSLRAGTVQGQGDQILRRKRFGAKRVRPRRDRAPDPGIDYGISTRRKSRKAAGTNPAQGARQRSAATAFSLSITASISMRR